MRPALPPGAHFGLGSGWGPRLAQTMRLHLPGAWCIEHHILSISAAIPNRRFRSVDIHSFAG